MAEPVKITKLAHSRVRGGVATIEAERLELGDALTRTWPSDAHMQLAYSPNSPRRRLVAAEIGRLAIELHAVAFDFDGPGHRADDNWRERFAERATSAAPGAFIYFTRNGARIVGRFAEPFAITSPADALRWRACYTAQCARFAAHGLDADRACADWGRLFRLPRATRDLGGAPEQWPTIGDPHNIGTIGLPQPRSELRPHAPAQPRAQRAVQGGVSESTALLRDLERAGLIVGPGPAPGSFRIICPNDRSHTTGAPGDGSTIYYPPRDFCGGGFVHCFHRCAEIRTAREWRRRIASYAGHRGSRGSPLAGGVSA